MEEILVIDCNRTKDMYWFINDAFFIPTQFRVEKLMESLI